LSLTAHVFPNIQQLAATKAVHLDTDASFVLLITTGTFNFVAATEAYTTVAQFLANTGSGGGGAVTETTGGSYARQALSSITLATSALVTTMGCANPSWAASTITAKYALFYTCGSGGSGASANDATSNLLMAYWDFGASPASSAGAFTLTVSGSGLITWTAT
jgi:hypothetical protein